jgi:hypothetical protein
MPAIWDSGISEAHAAGKRAIAPAAEPALSEAERWLADYFPKPRTMEE